MMSTSTETNHSSPLDSVAVKQLTPGIYVISTPIGNLGDITLRALETLRSVAVIYCEDTRVTSKLLRHFGIRKQLMRYDDHQGDKIRPQILEAAKKGQAIGLVSDAGTPLLSDPGFKLVKEAAALGIKVIPIPGVSSITTALSVGGVPPYPFTFHGFLPAQKNARLEKFQSLSTWRTTHVFFERASRLPATLAEIAPILTSCNVAIGRELTKRFEEVMQGTLHEIQEQIAARPPLKGEIVLMLHQPHEAIVSDDRIVQYLIAARKTQSLKAAVAETAEALALSRRRVYQIALQQDQSSPKTDASADDNNNDATDEGYDDIKDF